MPQQLPLFPDTPETPKKVEQSDPLSNPSVQPDFSLFPEPEEILYVTWNAMISKWVPIYKSENNKR